MSHDNNNNLEESYIQKEAKHEPFGWAMFTRCSFDKKENKIIFNIEEKIVLKNYVKN